MTWTDWAWVAAGCISQAAVFAAGLLVGSSLTRKEACYDGDNDEA
jgi:hypothetical protein